MGGEDSTKPWWKSVTICILVGLILAVIIICYCWWPESKPTNSASKPGTIVQSSSNQAQASPAPENLDEVYQAAVDFVNNDKTTKYTNDDGLAFYARYKIVTKGPCTGSRPGALRFEACAKFDAWKGVGDMSKEQAKQEYIGLLDEKVENWRQN